MDFICRTYFFRIKGPISPDCSRTADFVVDSVPIVLDGISPCTTIIAKMFSKYTKREIFINQLPSVKKSRFFPFHQTFSFKRLQSPTWTSLYFHNRFFQFCALWHLHHLLDFSRHWLLLNDVNFLDPLDRVGVHADFAISSGEGFRTDTRHPTILSFFAPTFILTDVRGQMTVETRPEFLPINFFA